MSKPKKKISGFSGSKQQVAKRSTDHAAKEQEALTLMNQGKLQEAETIYRDLIAAGMNSHVVYGNLAAI